MKVCFIEHKNIEKKEELKNLLKETIKKRELFGFITETFSLSACKYGFGFILR